MQQARGADGALYRSLRDATDSMSRYLAARFPPRTHGIAVLATFVCAYALYCRAGGGGGGWTAPVGAVSFVLLFLQMRLIDDLDDCASDAQGGSVDEVRRRRRALLWALASVVAAVCALNAPWPAACALAVVAVALTALTPFVLRRFLISRRYLLGIAYEIGPAIVLLYVYAFWTETSGRTLPLGAVVTATVLLWTGYEFWKFSRKIGLAEFQPYGLSWGGATVTLRVLLAAAAAAAVLLAVLTRVSPVLPLYTCVLCAAFALWIAREPAPADPGRYAPVNPRVPLPRWRGLPFVALLQAGIVLTAVLPLRPS
ncbi:hypothetical protein AB0D14_16565 [Streptomyces sp. NPDC048484]|uniref:hypothetical protein n=1 Tax=Streptomyces sp. NPDC048484 TaxID=3155146 RepID=UPI003426E97C